MVENTSIEWCDHTFNPWEGCVRVSPGCDHCYAETRARRFGNGSLWEGERRRTSPSYWQQPRKWNRRAADAGVRETVFCASLADSFDNGAPAFAREDLFELQRETPSLDWLMLTKRPENIKRMRPKDWGDGYRNVALGVSVENQEEADRRIPLLLANPAAMHFLSIEPLLGPVDLSRWLGTICRIKWVIVGGESGPGARPMNPEWVRALRDQCVAAGVAFFFKQWGEWAPMGALGGGSSGPVADRNGNVRDWKRQTIHNTDMHRAVDAHSFTEHATSMVFRVGKKAAGAVLDGREWRERPTWAR